MTKITIDRAIVEQEPVGRTDQQIVDQTEELAVWLLHWAFSRQPETPTPMRESRHPIAERCWAAACHIQEMLTATDPENAVSELDGEAPEDTSPQPAQQPVQKPAAWMESPHGAIRANPDYKFAFPSQLLQWKIPLYTCPPKGEQTVPSDCADSHQPKPLTDEQIDALELPLSGTGTVRDLVRVIERAHGIGGSNG